MSLIAVAVLAAGTYMFRLAGPAMRQRVSIPAQVVVLLKRAASVLLVGLIATAALLDGGKFAGWALPCGVLVAGFLAWRKAPIVVVVIAAAATTALLRFVGIE